MKHTPGPWRIEEDTTNAIETYKGELIAETSTRRREYDANARLIAAAPELLEAGAAVDIALRRMYQPAFAEAQMPAELQNAYARLRAAIAKAESQDGEGPAMSTPKKFNLKLFLDDLKFRKDCLKQALLSGDRDVDSLCRARHRLDCVQDIIVDIENGGWLE